MYRFMNGACMKSVMGDVDFWGCLWDDEPVFGRV